ncbi:hypothetical protein ACMBCM_08065, partial [Spiroplasma sp. K1]
SLPFFFFLLDHCKWAKRYKEHYKNTKPFSLFFLIKKNKKFSLSLSLSLSHLSKTLSFHAEEKR